MLVGTSGPAYRVVMDSLLVRGVCTFFPRPLRTQIEEWVSGPHADPRTGIKYSVWRVSVAGEPDLVLYTFGRDDGGNTKGRWGCK